MTIRYLLMLTIVALASLALTPSAPTQAADDGPALLAAGAKALSTGDHENAVKQLTRAMRADGLSAPQIAKALYLRGVAFRNAGRPAQAISDLTGALWLQGLDKGEIAQAHLNRGLAYEAVGMDELAKDDARKAKEIDSGARVVAEAEKPRTPQPSVSAFRTEVETASPETPSQPPRKEQQRQETEPPPTMPRRAPPPETTSFQTEVKTADRQPESDPSLRTSIMPEDPAKARQPEAQPLPKAPPPSATAPDWSTTVSNERQEKADEKEKDSPGAVSRFFSGLWSRKDDKAEKPEQNQNAPLASPWTQTTKVNTTAEPQAAPDATGREYRIQLAAVRSEDEAQQIWKRLAARHQDLLSDRQPVIEKTDLGSLGTFYRIQVGPYVDKRESQQLCNAFKRSGVDCFLVAR